MLMPSTRQATTWARFSMVKRFMLTIMLDRSSLVRQKGQFVAVKAR